MREFLQIFFLDHMKYRDLVLHSLSLVDASLPELHLMSIDLLTVFLRNISLGSEEDVLTSTTHAQFTAENVQLGHPTLGKKVLCECRGWQVG